MQPEQMSENLPQDAKKQNQIQIPSQMASQKIQKNDQQQQINNLSLLSVSVSSYAEKQQKQSSNDGLNSQRSYPSTISNYNDKDKPLQNVQQIKRKTKKRQRKTSTHYLKGKIQPQVKQDTTSNEDSSDDDESSQSQGSQLQYHANGSRQGAKASLTLVRLFFMICKKQYFYEIVRIFVYALISISVFSYVLDQNRQKKEFYQAFYSSQQITISKDINGVFPPLFGSQNDIVNHTWILESYNSHLVVNSQASDKELPEELLFEFKLSNVLYIRPNIDTCAEQLKFRWKTFDYNMRIYEVIESDFQKIQEEQNKNCFKNKKHMAQKMKEISLWTIDWQSKQLYLLTEPFRDEIIDQNGNSKPERWNELIVLKKQHLSI